MNFNEVFLQYIEKCNDERLWDYKGEWITLLRAGLQSKPARKNYLLSPIGYYSYNFAKLDNLNCF